MSQSVDATTHSLSLGVKFAICLVAFFLVGLSVGVVLLRTNTSTPTPEIISQVYAKIQYNGQWRGAYGNPSALISWNGSGNKEVIVTRSGATWMIYAGAQKMDDSANILKVLITKTDGTILNEANTTVAYGGVEIGYKFEENIGSPYTPPQTFTFMKTEELKITNMAFTGTGTTITLTIKNPGTNKVTVSEARVNDVKVTTTNPTFPASYDAGASDQTLVLTSSWTAGNKYKVTLLSATGTTVAAYEATA